MSISIVTPDGGLTLLGYIFCSVLTIALILCAAWLSGKNSSRQKLTTKQLVYCAAAVALSFVTAYIKVFSMPYGGSVTLFSMLFICLIGYWYGLKGGMMAAIAYGILQLVVDPYIISIPQIFTDYIFGFGALGFSGIFSQKKYGLIKGYIAGILGRYFFTFLSGMIFFGSYASGYHMSAPVYSLIYNGSYIGLEALLTLMIVSLPPVKKGLERVKGMAIGE